MTSLAVKQDGFRGHDIAGKRFGMLTAIRPVERNKQGIVWICRCDCGGLALRAVARLNRAKKEGQQSGCRLCNEEVFRGYLEAKRLGWLETLSARVAAGYGLWTQWDDVRLSKRIRDDIAESEGFYPDVEAPDAWIDPSYFDQSPDVAMVVGSEEKCVNLISEVRKDPDPELSLIDAALKRARELALTNEDQHRAMQSAIFFSHAGGEMTWISFSALAIRWQCGIQTVKYFVDQGLPTSVRFLFVDNTPVERGVLVPKVDHWLARWAEVS